MRSLRIFFVGGLISYRALLNFLSPPVFVPVLLVTPLFQILLFAYIGRSAGLESDEFYVIGNALQYATVPCLFGMSQAVAGERFQRTLGYILVAPVSRLPLFLGRALPVVANGAIIAAVSFAAGALLLGVDVPARALGPLAVVVLVTAFSCTGLGLINAGLGLRIREVAVLTNILFGFLLVFTGANVPPRAMPDWMRAVAEGLPLTHGIEAARRIVDGATLTDVAGTIAAEAGVGVAYGVVGYALIRFMEIQGRRRATLEVA